MADLAGARVLVVSNEQVGARMAGPAIRASSIARELQARGASVTLAMPHAPDAAGAVPAGVSVATFGMPNARRFAELARAHDVVVTQPQRVDVAWALRRAARPVVYDLYVPSFVERIAQLGSEPMAPSLKARLLERDRMEYAAAIELGSAFICATDRQKDHWLGALGQAGRLDVGLLERDARADALIGVVPFGLASEPAPELAPGEGAVRGKLVPDDAVVLLWTGGIWNWFDPVTVLEGLARARTRAEGARLHLVVMGVHHPEAAWEEQDAARALRERADELGLLACGAVVLCDAWVPYAERHRFLLDADAGVCAHRDTLETRLSFRTRFLDHLWAGLPTISTAGGELTDRMAAVGAAIVVPELDAEAWEVALLELATDEPQRARMSVAALDLAESFHWTAVTEPLARIVAELTGVELAAIEPRPRPRWLEAVRYALLLVRVRIQAKGLSSLAEAARGAAGGRVEVRGDAPRSESRVEEAPTTR